MKKFILLITLAGTLAFSSVGIYANDTYTYTIHNMLETPIWFGPFSVSEPNDLRITATPQIVALNSSIGNMGTVTLVVTTANKVAGNFQYGYATGEYQSQSDYCYVQFNNNPGIYYFMPILSGHGTIKCDYTGSGGNYHIYICKSTPCSH